MLDSLLAHGLADLAHKVAHRCTESERLKLVSDFDAGRKHLSFVIKLKLSSWLELPLSMVGIAHHDEDKAREQLRLCLRQYAAADLATIHPMCHAVLGLGSRVREQCLRVLGGTPRADCPELVEWLAKFRIILVSERHFCRHFASPV